MVPVALVSDLASSTRPEYIQAGLPNILMRTSEDNKSGEIQIYGVLDEWGFQKREFNYAFDQLKNAEIITVRIDSDGGNPYDAFYIHDALRNHKARIITRVDGVAASAAAIVMLAGDVRQIVENGWVMIHSCYGTVKGGADDLENYATVMRKINATYAGIVANATGLNLDDVVKMMNKGDTWFTGKEAFDSNFATEILAPVKIAARASLSSYENAPPALKSIMEAKMSDKDKDQGKDSAAGATTATVTGNDTTDQVTEKVVNGLFSKIAGALGITMKTDNTVDTGKDAGVATAATTTVPTTAATPAAPADISAIINQAVEAKLSSSLDGIRTALTESLAPVLTTVQELKTQNVAAAAVFRNARIVNRLENLVNSGRLTPAQFSAQKTLLTSATISDDNLESYLSQLEKSPSLLAATSPTLPVDPDSGEVLDLPVEITPPTNSGYVVSNIHDAKIVAKAKEAADKVQGDPQKKYEEFRRTAYALSGEGTPRVSLAF